MLVGRLSHCFYPFARRSRVSAVGVSHTRRACIVDNGHSRTRVGNCLDEHLHWLDERLSGVYGS